VLVCVAERERERERLTEGQLIQSEYLTSKKTTKDTLSGTIHTLHSGVRSNTPAYNCTIDKGSERDANWPAL